MVASLVRQLDACPEVTQIILTRNIAEPWLLQPGGKLEVIDNKVPLGFGANHNQAFRHSRERFFCVLNPDVELADNPFPILSACLASRRAALVAPLVLSPEGIVEDSARHFPTGRSLFLKALGLADGRYPAVSGQAPFFAEWVAGMFMLFDRAAFECVAGFDEDFFLYYEDVDICVRLWTAGFSVMACPNVSIVHAAQRDSRRRPRYLRWHLASLARYFRKHGGRLPDIARRAAVTGGGQ